MKNIDMFCLPILLLLSFLTNGLDGLLKDDVSICELSDQQTHVNNFGILCGQLHLPNEPNNTVCSPPANETDHNTFLICSKYSDTEPPRCLCPGNYKLSNDSDVTTSMEWSVKRKKCVIKKRSPCLYEETPTPNTPECYTGNTTCVNGDLESFGVCGKGTLLSSHWLLITTIMLFSLGSQYK